MVLIPFLLATIEEDQEIRKPPKICLLALAPPLEELAAGGKGSMENLEEAEGRIRCEPEGGLKFGILFVIKVWI